MEPFDSSSAQAPQPRLVPLRDSALTVSSEADDIRGRAAVDTQGRKLGQIDDLVLEDSANDVQFVDVVHGGFLGLHATHDLIPIEAIVRIGTQNVVIDPDRAAAEDTPRYHPELMENPDFRAREGRRRRARALWFIPGNRGTGIT